jgi:hypothetical protein
MKRIVRTILAAAAMLGPLTFASFAAAPEVDAARATRLATDYLNTLGANAPYIVSVTLEKSSLVGGSQSWIIRWSAPIVEGSQSEIGVRVKMDGTLAHLVEDKEARKKRAVRGPMLR